MERRKKTYEPSREKMYHVHEDPISRERIQVMSKIFKEVNTQHPGVFGMSVFGSISKGKELTAENAHADIDYFLYLDRDLLHDVHIEEAIDNNRYKEIFAERIKRRFETKLHMVRNGLHDKFVEEKNDRIKNILSQLEPGRNQKKPASLWGEKNWEKVAAAIKDDELTESDMREEQEERWKNIEDVVINLFEKIRDIEKEYKQKVDSLLSEKDVSGGDVVKTIDQLHIAWKSRINQEVTDTNNGVLSILEGYGKSVTWEKLKNLIKLQMWDIEWESMAIGSAKILNDVVSGVAELLIEEGKKNQLIDLDINAQSDHNAVARTPFIFSVREDSGDVLDHLREKVHEAYTKEEQPSDPEGAKIKIACLFGLDVGGGMKKFRRAFFLQTKHAIREGEMTQEEAKELWTKARRAIFETRYKDTTHPEEALTAFNKQFPDTFEDAYTYYVEPKKYRKKK